MSTSQASFYCSIFLIALFVTLCFHVLKHERSHWRSSYGEAVLLNATDDEDVVPRTDLVQSKDGHPHPSSKERDEINANDKTETSNTDSTSCLQYVVYDKTPKTGSASISMALHEHLIKTDEKTVQCHNPRCMHRAEAICKGEIPPEHVNGHLQGREHVFNNVVINVTRKRSSNLVECLLDRGFYAVTSIRDPKERWLSLYFYRSKKKSDNFNWTLEEYTAKFPRCNLFDYFDGLGKECTGPVSVDERIKTIVERYDEVFDLSHEPFGPFEKRVRKNMQKYEINKVPRPEKYPDIDPSLLVNETKLYNALRALRTQLPKKNRRLCKKLLM